jgi:hypothetical protein
VKGVQGSSQTAHDLRFRAARLAGIEPATRCLEDTVILFRYVSHLGRMASASPPRYGQKRDRWCRLRVSAAAPVRSLAWVYVIALSAPVR